MVIGTIPPDIATKEQLLVWVVSEIRADIAANSPTATYPAKITEAQGYYPSDVISIQEISTIDGGDRHILRILMPVDPAYYGASNPVYQYCGLLRP